MLTNANLTIPGTDAKLGDRVRDVVTQFEGIATSYNRHLTGCDDVWIQGQAGGEEQKYRGQWCDVFRLEVVERDVLSVESRDHVGDSG